jgi:hypothetical protein
MRTTESSPARVRPTNLRATFPITSGLVILLCVTGFSFAGYSSSEAVDCTDSYAAGRYATYLNCMATQGLDDTGRQGFANLKLGWLCLIGGTVSDSIYHVCRGAMSVSSQGSDLSSPVDKYAAGLESLVRGEFKTAASRLKEFASRPESKGVSKVHRERAAALAEASQAWANGGDPAPPSSESLAPYVEGWRVVVKRSWPNANRLGSNPAATPLGRLLLALAKRNPADVEKAALDDALLAAEIPEAVMGQSRAFYDPLTARIASVAHFYVSEQHFLAGVKAGKIAQAEDAAYAAMLAGDWEGLAILTRESDLTFARAYAALLPGSGKGAQAVSSLTETEPASILAQARVLGFGFDLFSESSQRYATLIKSAKSPGKQSMLQEELGCLGFVQKRSKDAAGNFQKAVDAPVVAPLGIISSQLGTAGYRDLDRTSELYENLASSGGWLAEFHQLAPLAESARLFIWLYKPVEGTNPVKH